MNKRGQALIEFIMILPVIILIVFGSIDIGNLFINKYQMVNDLDMIIDVKDNQAKVDSILTDNNEELTVIFDHGRYKYTLSKKVSLFTPGLNMVLENPYRVRVDRVVYE